MKAKRIPPSGLPLFFWQACFPSLLPSSFSAAFIPLFCRLLGKCIGKNGLPPEGEGEGEEGGAPQLLFAVRKRYHLPILKRGGGRNNGCAAMTLIALPSLSAA